MTGGTRDDDFGWKGMSGSPTAVDVMTEENRAAEAMTVCCWWRPDLDHTAAEDYWRDVHGVQAARIPGLWSYRQLRFGPNRADLMDLGSDVQRELDSALQPHGVPHGQFLDQTDQQAFASSPQVTRDIFADERNFVARNATQLSPGGAARTLVDRLHKPAVQGSPTTPTFAVFSTARGDLAAAHAALSHVLAPTWAARDDVLRLRVVPPLRRRGGRRRTAAPPPGRERVTRRSGRDTDTAPGMRRISTGGAAVAHRAIRSDAVRGRCGGRPSPVSLEGCAAIVTGGAQSTSRSSAQTTPSEDRITNVNSRAA